MIPVNSQCSIGEVVNSLGQYIDLAVSKAVAGETGTSTFTTSKSCCCYTDAVKPLNLLPSQGVGNSESH